jgi:hypothetical protein
VQWSANVGVESPSSARFVVAVVLTLTLVVARTRDSTGAVAPIGRCVDTRRFASAAHARLQGLNRCDALQRAIRAGR